MSDLDPAVAERLKRDPNGLVPAVVQEASTKDVLMLAWMDDEALRRTLESGRATYWSRSRQEYWVKGETSGHVQQVREVRLDCDGDTLLAGRTSVTIAHRLSTAESADRVLVFDAGRLVQDGSHAELVAEGGVYGRLHASWVAQSNLPGRMEP